MKNKYYFVTYSQRRGDRTSFFPIVMGIHPFKWEKELIKENKEDKRYSPDNMITHIVSYQEITKEEYDYWMENNID